jgi:monoamine oxidase
MAFGIETDRMRTIIIVGGGICGLAAATALLEHGNRVTILEATDRLGGRIHTLQGKFSQPVELGAEFIHGKQPRTFALIKEARCKAVLRKGNHYTILNGFVNKGDMVDDEWDIFMRELNNLQQDTDLTHFLNTHFGGPEYNGLRERVRRFAEGFDLADPDRVSTISLGKEWSNSDDEHQYHIAGGYQQLIDYLAKEVRDMGGTILTGSKVVEIHWRKGRLTAILENGSTLDAEHAIITVSLGILKKGKLHFIPPIPDHEEAFRNIGFGGAIKFLFEFNEPFWLDRDAGPFKKLSFIFSDAPVPTWWTQRPDKFPLLTGWIGATPAYAAPKESDELYENAERSLCYILKCDSTNLRSQLNHWHIANWNEDPNHFGAYTYPMIRTPDARRLLTTPVSETLFFAGEGLHEGDSSGTVEAALANGLRVAQSITQLHNVTRR